MRFVSWFNNLSMRVKLVSLVAVQLVVIGAAFMWMFRSEVTKAAKDDTLAQASRVVDMAESIRQGMAEKWKQGVFSHEEVAEWANEGKVDKVLSTVPIVTAWEAVMLKAEEGGYQFRTPRFDPRNPDNSPDDVEARALQLFASSAESEYSEFDKAHNTVRYFRPIRLTQECLMCHGDPKTSKDLWGNEDGIDGTGYAMENLSVGDLYGAYEVVQSLDASDARAQTATTKGFGLITTFIVLACLVLVWILNRSLLKPLQMATDAFAKLLSGDLRHQLNVTGNDEIGRLQAGINAMVQQLRKMIGSMRNNSEELGSVSTALQQTAEEVDQAATSTTTRSHTVSSAAEEMSQSLESMKNSLGEVTTKVQSVAAATNQVMANADSVANNTAESAQIARNAAVIAAEGGEQIKQLENAADGIGEIVDVIKDIAEQTNLLALNATIEASRAGESGKGFAVVAAEVKQLARETADATNGISERIGSIQNISGQVVGAMQEIEKVVQSVSECTEETSKAVVEQRTTIESVTTQVAEAADLTEAVSLNVDETVAAAREVSESIHEVNAIAQKTAAEVTTTKEASKNVKLASESFSEQLAAFEV